MLFTKKVMFVGVFLIFAAAAIFLIVSINTVDSKSSNSGSVSVQDVNNAIINNENFTLLDVRTREEYETGFLQNSILLPIDQVESGAADVLKEKDKKVYIYCRSGRRSQQAVTILKNMGYNNVHSMEGGINAWNNSGLPVIK